MYWIRYTRWALWDKIQFFYQCSCFRFGMKSVFRLNFGLKNVIYSSCEENIMFGRRTDYLKHTKISCRADVIKTSSRNGSGMGPRGVGG